jgi:3-methyladenine DNA glycosylase AlkD
MQIWDLVKSSEAWSIEDIGRHNAPKNDYLFKHKQDLQKD